MGTPERIREVARRIAARREEVDGLAVVVSAMGGETDRLIGLAREVNPNLPSREYDVLLSSGEQVSAALLAMSLEEMGVKARSFLSFQLPVFTDGKHSTALIKDFGAERLREAFARGEVAVVAGFQGINQEGDITTLGRGGSDTTAVAMAAALQADMCEIYTDVEGVYTCDPGICAEARKLQQISYDEMMELAVLGAKVLHTRCVEMAKRFGVNLLVRSSFNNEEGTMVCKEGDEVEGALIAGVTYTRGEAKISVLRVPDTPGVVYRIFAPLAEMGINVDMIIQNISRDNYTDVTFTVPEEDLDAAVKAVETLARQIGADGVLYERDIAKVSIVGDGMKTHPGVASRMFGALAEEGINIIMISTSEIKISCVIDARYTELAVRVLHDAFELGAAEQS